MDEPGRLEAALAQVRRAVAGARACLPEHGLLASLLLRQGRNSEADAVIQEAATLEPGTADAYDGLAFVSALLGQHARANAFYWRATELAPLEPRFWYNLACSERSFGRLAEAESACDRAIGLDATQYPTWLLRSELRVQSDSGNHVRELEAQLQRPALEYRGRLFLGYALAKELDDLGRFEQAFEWFERSSATRRGRLAYDVARDEHKLARIAASYPAGALPRDAADDDSARHIFIVGLPRSGTTLLERILTGLPGVRSNGETDNFSRALLESARGSGDVFARCAAADPRVVGAAYRRYADPGSAGSHVIEKLPLNCLYIGAIRRALPAARILLLRRAPLDSCFAMFRTLFGAGYPFSYDLRELGRYYGAYQRLMQHWRSCLGDSLHEVSYEELVGEPRVAGARIAHHCGITWDDAAVDIQNNRSVSLTASAAQVRRPIYGSSSGRWRHYRAYLQPLIATLGAQNV